MSGIEVATGELISNNKKNVDDDLESKFLTKKSGDKNKNEQNAYIVNELVESRQIISGFGITSDIEMCWTKGMIGVIHVFSDRKNAEIYSKGKYEITTIKKKE